MRRQSSPLLPVLVLLLLANGALGAAVYGEITNPQMFVRHLQIGTVSAPDTDSLVARPGADPALAIPGEAAFAVISNRPLFSPDRLPPETPLQTPAGPISNQLPPVVVTGIVGAGEDSIAILTDPSPKGRSEPGYVVRAGDTVLGWNVEAIVPEDRKVVLAKGDERHDLFLVEDNTTSARPRVPTVRPPVVRPRQTAPQAVSPGVAPGRLRIPGQQPSTQ